MPSRERPAHLQEHPRDIRHEPDGPALGTYPAVNRGVPWPDRRSTVGEKLARFLNRLAERAREWR